MCLGRMRRFHKIRQTEPRPRSCSQGLAYCPGIACIEFVAQNRKRPHAQISTVVAGHPERSRGIPPRNLKGNFNGVPRTALGMTGLLANNPARAFFDELDEMGDLFARLDLVPSAFDCLA